MRRRTTLACTTLAAVLAVTGAGTALADGKRPFKTERPPMLTKVRADVQISPLMTVGDRLRSGYRFESIPDGISLRSPDRKSVEVYVNHETGKVPFPYNPSAPTEANGENDFDNSQVSRLTLDRHSGGVLSGRFAISSRLGYQRFCSNYLATWRESFEREILFTNEESPDYVFRRENSWPPPIGHRREKEAGLVVALDVKSGRHHEIHGMGRHNHENSVPIPGYGKPVVLSGDDTFTSGPLLGVESTPNVPAQSQLYSYIAKSTKSLLRDDGDLWAFVSDNPAVRSYYDVPPNSTVPVTGRFIKVPRRIATGLNRDGSEVQSEDVGYPDPPDNGSWQLDLRTAPRTRRASTARSGCSSTGATSTTCSSSCASRTSPTTSGAGWGTSSTSWTRAEAGPPPSRWTRRTSGRRTAGCGRWCSTRTTRSGSTRSPCSSRVRTTPSRPRTRSTSRTTSSPRRTGC